MCYPSLVDLLILLLRTEQVVCSSPNNRDSREDEEQLARHTQSIRTNNAIMS